MQLTKPEYIALEILKHRDVSVDESWEMAWAFLDKASTPAGNDVLETTDPYSLDISGFYTNCIPQGRRVLQVGQVWCNWYRGYTYKVVSYNLEQVIYSDSRSAEALAPNINKLWHQQFLKNGWQWELLLKGETVEDCKERVELERSRLAELSILKSTPLDGSFLSGNTLDVTIRTSNVLKSKGILTYADLLKTSQDDLIRFDGMGKKGLNEIIDELEKNGLYLGMLKVSD